MDNKKVNSSHFRFYEINSLAPTIPCVLLRLIFPYRMSCVELPVAGRATVMMHSVHNSTPQFQIEIVTGGPEAIDRKTKTLQLAFLKRFGYHFKVFTLKILPGIQNNHASNYKFQT